MHRADYSLKGGRLEKAELCSRVASRLLLLATYDSSRIACTTLARFKRVGPTAFLHWRA